MGAADMLPNTRLLAAAIEQATECIVITDPAGTIQYVNSAYTDLTGYSAEEAIGKNAHIHKSGKHPASFYADLWTTIRSGQEWHGEMTNRRKDGTLYQDEMRIIPVHDSNRAIIHYIAIKHDVSERREREQDIIRSLEFARSTIDALPSNICVLDENGTIIAVNRAWHEFSAANGMLKADEAHSNRHRGSDEGTNYLAVCDHAVGEDSEEAAAFAEGIRAVLHKDREQFCAEYPCHSPAKKRWFMGRATRFRIDRLVRVLVEHIDITERRQAEDVLLFKNALLEGQTETTLDGIITVDDSDHIVLVNSQFAQQFGIPTEVLRLRDDAVLREFVRRKLDDPQAFFEKIDTLVRSREKARDEIRLKDGKVFDRYSAPLFDSKGQYRGRIWYHRDITDRKVAEARIENLAYYDALTGLPNRFLMSQQIGASLIRALLNRESVAVVFLDIDRFKIYNDSLGHGFGDLLLKEIAGRLRISLPGENCVGRIGGDEFIIGLGNVKGAESVSLTAQLLLQEVSRTLKVQGRIVNLSCSIGISLFPQHAETTGALIANAESAMFAAKDQGRNQIQFFTEEMQARALKRLTLENDMRLALERDQFFLLYQPQMNLASGRISGFEALIRWRHPTLGVLPPNEFIGVAEACGLILPIGEWVLERACAQARQWQLAGLLTGSMAVNVSAAQFSASGLVSFIRAVLDQTGLCAEQLELELTESMLLSDADMTSSVLRDLKTLGVKLAIDDFGTGYSSLNYLKRFRVDKLKIDRSFIAELTADADDAAITKAIISMARSLRLEVIAEGVENDEQLAFLREHQCDEIQGYYIGKPLQAVDVPAFLRHAHERWMKPVEGHRMAPSRASLHRAFRRLG